MKRWWPWPNISWSLRFVGECVNSCSLPFNRLSKPFACWLSMLSLMDCSVHLVVNTCFLCRCHIANVSIIRVGSIALYVIVCASTVYRHLFIKNIHILFCFQQCINCTYQHILSAIKVRPKGNNNWIPDMNLGYIYDMIHSRSLGFFFRLYVALFLMWKNLMCFSNVSCCFISPLSHQRYHCGA